MRGLIGKLEGRVETGEDAESIVMPASLADAMPDRARSAVVSRHTDKFPR
jgi:hypothetical protein